MIRDEGWVGWAGGAITWRGRSHVDVVSGIERIDSSTAAHDTEQTHVINALILIGYTSNGVSCRSEQISRSQPVESGSDLGTRHKYFFCFCFLFFAAAVLGLSLCCIFIFVIVLWSSRSMV